MLNDIYQKKSSSAKGPSEALKGALILTTINFFRTPLDVPQGPNALSLSVLALNYLKDELKPKLFIPFSYKNDTGIKG